MEYKESNADWRIQHGKSLERNRSTFEPPKPKSRCTKASEQLPVVPSNATYQEKEDYLNATRYRYRNALRDQLGESIKILLDQGYTAYAVTLTYKPNRIGTDHTPEQLERYFRKFYWDNFLPKHLFCKRSWLYNQPLDQPYVYVFTEDHEVTAVPDRAYSLHGKVTYSFPDKLHHHAILLVRPEHVPFMEARLGENKLNCIHPSIMSSYVSLADLGWINYCTKYTEEISIGMLMFGPIENSNKPVLH